MADYIAFVNNDADYHHAHTLYSHAKAIRWLLPALKLEPDDKRYKAPDAWIDAGLDGYHCRLIKGKMFDSWKNYMKRFKGSEILADSSFIEKPSNDKVETFVFSVLDYCARFRPTWVTIPQLPVVDGTSRNSINRRLAKATRDWAVKNDFTGHLVLPLVFTHQDQLKGRSQWRNTVLTAAKCYSDAGASAFWAADSTLDDQKCRAAFDRRFKALIAFHEDLKASQPRAAIISGPYWGMNIVLWAKGLCDHPAVSMGTGYSYMLSGAFAKRAKKLHVALPPLRRWVVASPELKTWLETVIATLAPDDNDRREFARLRQNLDFRIQDKNTAKDQVAKAYHQWFSKIESTSPEGRTLALYQDLSSAYVLGKQLPRLPKSEAPGRDPGKVAEQLMLHCL